MKSQLKAVMEDKQLPTSGTKSDLITRLEATLHEKGGNPDEFFLEKEEPQPNGEMSDILKLLQVQLAGMQQQSQNQSEQTQAQLAEMQQQTKHS
ncbi:MAG: SAP domain-containing protein [Candidatus Hodgkinia cicadicola]